MNTMTCKGYTARIEYDERDDILIGRVIGLRERISFEGADLAALHRDFAAAIDHYLADCKTQGVSPEKPVSGKMMLRVSPEVHGAALNAAQAAGLSLNKWAEELFRRAAQA